MKIGKILLTLLVALIVISVVMQAIFRYQLRQEIDTFNINSVGKSEQFEREFGFVEDRIREGFPSRAGKWIVPLGPLFSIRNNSTLESFHEISETWEGKRTGESDLRQIADEFYSKLRIPL